jgi:hypothetical protein
MIDIQTFATLPAKTCFVFLADGQGLPNRMDSAMHLFSALVTYRVFFVKESSLRHIEISLVSFLDSTAWRMIRFPITIHDL